MSVSITEQISIELASKIGVRIFTSEKCIIDNNRWLDSEKYILCPHQKTKTRPIGKEGQANSIHLYHFTDCFCLDKSSWEHFIRNATIEKPNSVNRTLALFFTRDSDEWEKWIEIVYGTLNREKQG